MSEKKVTLTMTVTEAQALSSLLLDSITVKGWANYQVVGFYGSLIQKALNDLAAPVKHEVKKQKRKYTKKAKSEAVGSTEAAAA